MFISDKYALYRFVNNYASSGSYLFFRTGSSDDVPTLLRNLAASSVATTQLVYKLASTGSDSLLRRSFARSRTYQPIGGYGQRRTYTVNGQQVQTYHVIPEKVDCDADIGTLTPEQWAVRAGLFGDFQAGGVAINFIANAKTVLDFGRTLRFRGLSAFFVAALTTDAVLEWSSDGQTWTVFQQTLVNGDYQFDFTARYIRVMFRTVNASVSQASMQFWAERGTEPAVRPITHAVWVPNITSATLNGLTDTTKTDYVGLVLDVGTDIKIDTVQTGKFGHINVQDFVVPIKALPRQGA